MEMGGWISYSLFLMNELVYRLYQLTDEEIGLVEAGR